MQTVKKLLALGGLGLLFMAVVVYAQEPQRFERGIEIIRGNLSVGSGVIIFEGATGDDFETTLSVADPTADRTFTLPNATSGTFVVSTLATNGPDVANSIWGTSNALTMEGATADAFELSVVPADVTADRTVTFADATGTVMISTLGSNAPDVANSIWAVSGGLVFEGATANAFETTVTVEDPTADQTWTIPNSASDTFVGLAATQTLSAKTFVTPVLGVATGTSLAVTGLLTSSSATAGIGYTSGAGGTVTQLTDKSTGVTSNVVAVEITMDAAALGGDTAVTFTWTSSAVAADDHVLCHHDSAGTAGSYLVVATSAAGSSAVTVRNITTGSLSEAIVLKCSVLKSATS